MSELSPEDDFFHQGSRDDKDSGHLASMESTVIRRILRQASVELLYKQLQTEYRQDTRQPTMTLAWFLSRFPDFPLWLGVRKVAWQRDVFGRLKTAFTQTPAYLALEEVIDTQPEGDERPVGVVFTWPKWGVCILHNYQKTEDPFAKPGLWIVRRLGKMAPFFIEPLVQFLEYLAWTTD